jgi:putative oxidoreductase
MTLQSIISIGGRSLLALLFILAGIAKIVAPKPFLDHMVQYSVPSFLLPAVICLEIGAGAMLLSGWNLRYSAAILALFCLATAVVFHHSLGIPTERTQFFKDIALAGALAVIASSAWSAAPRS